MRKDTTAKTSSKRVYRKVVVGLVVAGLWCLVVSGTASAASPPPSAPNRLLPCEALYAGKSLVSTNGQFRLTYGTDGVLALKAYGVTFWSKSGGTPAGKFILQCDKNLLIRQGDGDVPWAVGIQPTAKYLFVLGDGTFHLSSSTAELWTAHTDRAYLRNKALAYLHEPMSSFNSHQISKPKPFNWTNDGCSNSPDWNFKDACERHDFGYRNFGSHYGALHLNATRAGKDEVDRMFAVDLKAVCDRYSGTAEDACDIAALGYYEAVHNYGDSAFFG